uniref:Uncharacterized protein n=1 Tax=Acanthochromis polyacanthus TaxID=80966 RepID=A0A3Q1G260_9TELE
MQQIQEDPLRTDAPLLGLLQRPQQVNAQKPEQQVEAHSKGGEEEDGVEVLPHAGTVDPLGSVEGLGDSWG